MKPATAHQEFRIPPHPERRGQKEEAISQSLQRGRVPCLSEELNSQAPSHLRHAVIIMTEMGLRPYKELLAMRREQVDLENRIVHIPDSKTEAGVADIPMTERVAVAARRRGGVQALGACQAL